MRVRIDEKDFLKYPFLKESQKFVGSYAGSPDRFITTPTGRAALLDAKHRILSAIGAPGAPSPGSTSTDREGIRVAVSGYALARLIVSCLKDRLITDRFTRYESGKAYEFLLDEDPGKKEYIAASLGLDTRSPAIPLVPYVELTSGMRDERWRLVNRDVSAGMVSIRAHESDELLREGIRLVIGRNLPLPVPENVCALFSTVAGEINAAEQQHLLEQFGTVEESSFPPCMQALITALSAGTNISHPGRFALTAFLHNIGMGPQEIIQLFCRAPDFDLSRTMYQVEHISGRGGTEYTAPSCAAMRTTGVCTKKDALCERISHPLNYYKQKKRSGKKAGSPGSGDMLVDRNAGGTHGEDKTSKGDKVRDSGRHHGGKQDEQDDEKDQA